MPKNLLAKGLREVRTSKTSTRSLANNPAFRDRDDGSFERESLLMTLSAEDIIQDMDRFYSAYETVMGYGRAKRPEQVKRACKQMSAITKKYSYHKILADRYAEALLA